MTTPRELLARYATQSQMSSFFIDHVGIISVKSYGAKGDGATDDTVAVQAAVTAAVANGNHELYFPHGTYKVTALTGVSTLTFVGDNSSFTGGYSGTINSFSAHLANTTTAHGAVSAATASKIIIRDAAGRAKVAAPSAEDDIALKSNVTTVQTNLTEHQADLITDADGAHGLKTEVGDFTPVLGSGDYTYSTQLGRYQKIGKLVSFQIMLAISAITTPGTGTFVITGLPFNAANITVTLYSLTISQLGYITFTGQIQARLVNGNQINFYQTTSGGAPAGLAYTGLAANSTMNLSGVYEIL